MMDENKFQNFFSVTKALRPANVSATFLQEFIFAHLEVLVELVMRTLGYNPIPEHVYRFKAIREKRLNCITSVKKILKLKISFRSLDHQDC